MEFLCFRGHCILWGIITFFFDGALARFGKISMEFLHLGEVYEGITARFGKISMEFLHLGGLQGNHTVVSKVQVMNTRMDQ